MRNSLSDAAIGEVKSFSIEHSAVVGRSGTWEWGGGGSLAADLETGGRFYFKERIRVQIKAQTAERTFFQHLVRFPVTHDGRSRIKVIVPRGAFKNLFPVLT